MATERSRILVVDDEAAMREVLGMRLEEWGFDVSLASTGEEARQAAGSLDPDVVVSDVVLPDVSGLDLLKTLKQGNRGRPVILITAYGTIDSAVQAMRRGARDFLTKPLDYRKLRSILEAAMHEVEQRSATEAIESRLDHGAGLGSLIGTSKPMRKLFDLIKVLARSDASALLTGESGTGKEVVAQTLHDLSARKDRPFVAVNAAAIPEGLTESELFGHEKGAFTGAISSRPGLFEQANGGTLFLDELAEMPIALQPKLLRILEQGQVRRLGGRKEMTFDVRIIAATNREPEGALKDGLLRKDLYYRLSVFKLDLPPLTERKEDIPLLAQHFLKRFNRRHGGRVEGIDPKALDLLLKYSWPGNVRELANVTERGVILGREGFLEVRHLPAHLRDPSADAGESIVLPRGVTAAEAERIVILQTLERSGNNKAEAARRLGLDAKTIRNKLKAYGRDKPE